MASSTQSDEVWTGLLEGHPGVVITHSSVSLLQEHFRGLREIRDPRKVALGQECNQGAPSLHRITGVHGVECPLVKCSPHFISR